MCIYIYISIYVVINRQLCIYIYEYNTEITSKYTIFVNIQTGILDQLREGFPWPTQPFKHTYGIQLNIYTFKYTDGNGVLYYLRCLVVWPALHISTCCYRTCSHPHQNLPSSFSFRFCFFNHVNPISSATFHPKDCRIPRSPPLHLPGSPRRPSESPGSSLPVHEAGARQHCCHHRSLHYPR